MDKLVALPRAQPFLHRIFTEEIMKSLSCLMLVSCILAVLMGCQLNPEKAPLILQSDPNPLTIEPDTWTLTFYGLNFASVELEEYPYYRAPYLHIQGPEFSYYCTEEDYYAHACPAGLYVYFTFDAPTLYELLSELATPPYSGRFRVLNLGKDHENNGGEGDDKPGNGVPFEIR
jgi:hypothetical protein